LTRMPRGTPSAAARAKPSNPALTRLITALPTIGFGLCSLAANSTLGGNGCGCDATAIESLILIGFNNFCDGSQGRRARIRPVAGASGNALDSSCLFQRRPRTRLRLFANAKVSPSHNYQGIGLTQLGQCLFQPMDKSYRSLHSFKK